MVWSKQTSGNWKLTINGVDKGTYPAPFNDQNMLIDPTTGRAYPGQFQTQGSNAPGTVSGTGNPGGGGGVPVVPPPGTKEAATSGFTKFIKSITAGELIKTGVDLFGTYQANKAANQNRDAQTAENAAQRAADAAALEKQLQLQRDTLAAQTKAQQDAVRLQGQMYNTTQGQQAPYRGIGASALGPLGYWVGLPGYEQGNTGQTPYPYTPAQPIDLSSYGGSASPTATLANGTPPAGTPLASSAPNESSAGTVTLRAPDGSTRSVPADQVAFYLSRGATRV